MYLLTYTMFMTVHVFLFLYGEIISTCCSYKYKMVQCACVMMFSVTYSSSLNLWTLDLEELLNRTFDKLNLTERFN